MKAKLILMILIIIPITSLGQITVRGGILGERREEEILEVLEEAAQREERINEYIRQQERDAQKRAEQIERGLLNAIQRNAPAPKATNATTVRRSGGLTISTDNSSVRTTSTRTARANQRKLQRKQEHQEWLKQRREEIEEQRRRQEERRRREELRRRQEEERRRQETYNRVYATEYQRAGLNSKRLSDKADWRVGEGAEIMDRTHSAKSLMQTPVHRNFDAKTAHSTKKHGIRSLSHRRVAIKGLDSHAIPWGTMKETARPWDEWYTRKQESLRIIIPSEPAKPVIPIDSTGIWKHMIENLGLERTNQIRSVLKYECDVIPNVWYETYDGCYHYYDAQNRKIIKISDNEVTINQLEENDDNKFKDIVDNVLDASISAGYKAPLSMSSEVSLSPRALIELGKNEKGEGKDEKREGKELLQFKASIGPLGANIKAETGKDSTAISTKPSSRASIKGELEVNNNDTKTSISKNGIDISYKKTEKEEDEEPIEIKGYAGLKAKLFENNSEKTTRTYHLSDNKNRFIQGYGIGHTIGMGLKIEGEAEGYAEVTKSRQGVGFTVSGEATVAQASLHTTVMLNKGNGVCFLAAESGGELGFAFKHKTGKKKDGKKEIERSIPVTFITPVNVKGMYKCYNKDEYSLKRP